MMLWLRFDLRYTMIANRFAPLWILLRHTKATWGDWVLRCFLTATDWPVVDHGGIR